MSEKSATPILVAGAAGTVALLGIAWMFAASAGEQARLNAIAYAESKAAAEAAVTPKAVAAPENTEEAVEIVGTEDAVIADETVEAAKEPEETMMAAVEKAPEPAPQTAVTEPVAQVAESAAETPAATVAAVSAALNGDVKAGKKVFRKCRACHKIGEGATNAVGPYLTGVIGRVQGSAEGYSYSEAFQNAMAQGTVWTAEEIDAFLTKPKDYMPGTKMNYAGLRKEKDRANVIAYINSQSE